MRASPSCVGRLRSECASPTTRWWPQSTRRSIGCLQTAPSTGSMQATGSNRVRPGGRERTGRSFECRRLLPQSRSNAVAGHASQLLREMHDNGIGIEMPAAHDHLRAAFSFEPSLYGLHLRCLGLADTVAKVFFG